MTEVENPYHGYKVFIAPVMAFFYTLFDLSSLKLNFLMIFSNFFNTPTKDCFLISFSDYASVAQPLAGGQS